MQPTAAYLVPLLPSRQSAHRLQHAGGDLGGGVVVDPGDVPGRGRHHGGERGRPGGCAGAGVPRVCAHPRIPSLKKNVPKTLKVLFGTPVLHRSKMGLDGQRGWVGITAGNRPVGAMGWRTAVLAGPIAVTGWPCEGDMVHPILFRRRHILSPNVQIFTDPRGGRGIASTHSSKPVITFILEKQSAPPGGSALWNPRKTAPKLFSSAFGCNQCHRGCQRLAFLTSENVS